MGEVVQFPIAGLSPKSEGDQRKLDLFHQSIERLRSLRTRAAAVAVAEAYADLYVALVGSAEGLTAASDALWKMLVQEYGEQIVSSR